MIIQNLIISCLFALAPISNVPVQDQQCNVQVVEYKHKSNYYSSGYYRHYNMGELVSNSFFRDVINYYPQTYGSGYNWLAVSSSSVGSATFNVNGAYSIYWYNTSNQDELIFNPSSFIISKVTDSTRSNGHIYSFTFGNASNQKLNFNFYTHNNMIGSNLSINGSAWTGISVDECMGYCFLREDLSNPNYELGRFIGYYDNTQMNNSYQNGYNEGESVGYNSGYDVGYTTGQSNAQNPESSIYQGIYQTGYAAGLQEGQSLDSTAATIFSGFIEVGLLPVNVLLKMFEYEVFGINIAGLISGLLTLAIGIIIIRTITGKKND